MKNSFNVLALLFCTLSYATEGDEKEHVVDTTDQSVEVVNMAKPVGYVVAIVQRGDNWKQDSIRAFQLQEKHLTFLETLRRNNQLVASGPLTTSPDARGLYIFRVETIEEAEALMASDEAISGEWIKMEFHVWQARNYEEPSAQTRISEESESSVFQLSRNGWLLVFFVLFIVVLMIRTFRNKPSV